MAGTQHLAPGKSRVLFPVGGDIRLVAVEYLPCVETDGLQGDLRAGAFTAVQPSGLEIQPDAYIFCSVCGAISSQDWMNNNEFL